MKLTTRFLILGTRVLTVPTVGLPAEETVATALYARIGNGYTREKAKDGSFKPEYYALSNGGRVYGTASDITVDRVTYLDDLADSNDIRRWAGGGDRYTDLLGDVEEARYYIVISAYDFPELMKNQKKRLLWQMRVSVRSPGNTFDDSFVPMLKSASKYFGQDSGKLIRGEEAKARVELGDLKFLGEVKDKPAEASGTTK